jgi:hypothetical protein
MFTHAYTQLPTEHKGKRVKQYLPYVLAGDLTINASNLGVLRAFQDGTFYHGIGPDLPFWVTHLQPSVAVLAADGSQIDFPVIGGVNHLVQLAVKLLGSSRDMTANPTRLSVLVNEDTQVWYWNTPVVLEQKDGFIVNGINNIPAASAPGGIRLEVAFHGAILVLE